MGVEGKCDFWTHSYMSQVVITHGGKVLCEEDKTAAVNVEIRGAHQLRCHHHL